MTQALKYYEIAEKLNMNENTVRKAWRSWPHYFAGTGRNLKSARFDLTDVINYLKNRDYADRELKEKERNELTDEEERLNEAKKLNERLHETLIKNRLSK